MQAQFGQCRDEIGANAGNAGLRRRPQNAYSWLIVSCRQFQSSINRTKRAHCETYATMD